MLYRPPLHRIDATGVYFVRDDPALDTEKIEREKAVMISLGADPDNHPIERYLRGETRFDLKAPLVLVHEGAAGERAESPVSITGYFKDAVTAFKLRRLGRVEYRDVFALARRGQIDRGNELAARKGLRGVDGLADFGAVSADGLTDEQLGYLHDVDPRLIGDLGNAVYRFSAKLTLGEDKPSG